MNNIIADNDNIYYSIDVFNNSNKIMLASYVSQQNTPFINNRTGYKLNIIKFIVPSNSIPLFIYKEEAEIVLRYGANIYPTNPTDRIVKLTNLDLLSVPPKPQTIINNTSAQFEIYGLGSNTVYYYWQFLQAINYTLALAFSEIGIAGNPPYFIFNEQTQLFSLIAEVQYDESNPGYNGVEILSNTFVYKLFLGMTSFYYSLDTGFTNYNNKYLVYNKQNLNNITTSFSTPGYIMTAQTSSVAYWFFARKILIYSNTTNIVPLGQNNPDNRQISIPKSQNIIADFAINFNTSLAQFSPYEYIQLGKKDNIDFYNNNSLNTIDIQIFWEDQFYRIFPLILLPSESFQIELLFKKTYFNT